MSPAKTFTLTEFPNENLIKNIWTHPSIWSSQRDEVRNYCNLYDNSGIDINYIKYNDYGRFFVEDHKVRSSTIMWSPIRSALFQNTEYDIDIINCHSNLLLDILKTNEIYDIECLEYYCKNRDEIIDLFDITEDAIESYNVKKKEKKDKKDIVKALVTQLLYGGSIESWKKEYNITLEMPEFIINFQNEIKTNTSILLKDKRFKDIINYEYKRRRDKEYPNGVPKNKEFEVKDSKYLAIILQEYESLIIMKIFEIVKNNGFIITSYNYDGFQILKREGVEDLIELINNTELSLSHSNKNFINFENIKFIVKPFKDPIDVSKLICLETDEFNRDVFNLSSNYNYKKKYFEKYFAKILNPTLFVESKKNDYVVYKRSDFGVAYQHLWYVEYKFNMKLGEMVSEDKPFINKWLADEKIRLYSNVDYYPTANMCPKNTFNLWGEFPIKDIPLDENADTSRVHYHIKTLLGDDDKNYEWYMNWLAHIVKFPHKKTEVCVVLYDRQFGTGKSILAEKILEKIISLKKIMVTCKMDKAFGRFANLQGKLLCVLNEASGKDTFELAEVIKESITGSNIEMEKKGVDSIQIKDYMNYIVTTNNLNSVKLEDGDRRFMVFNTSSKLKGDYAHFNNLVMDLEDDVVMRKFYEELMTRDLSQFNPSRDRPANKIMEVMKEHNIDVILEFINYWKQEVDDDDGMFKTKMKGMDLYKEFCRYYEMCGNNMNSRPSLTKFGTRIKNYEELVEFKKLNYGNVYKLVGGVPS